MTRLDSILAGAEWARSDVARLKESLPSLAALPGGMVEMLYERFSQEQYDASWMGSLDDELLAHFGRWLGEDVGGGPCLPR